MSPVFSGDVLIVEDNFIIAMDAEALMRDLGATKAHIANSSETALQLIETEAITAAILDFNLNDETSVAVADALMKRSIPFVFATGYSDPSVMPDRFQTHVLLDKPYLKDDIRAAFQALNDR